MPTVSAAIEGLSSCSQNVAYSANIIAAQVRKAKTQAETGNPAIVVVGRAPSVLVTGPIRACARAALASLRGMLRLPVLDRGRIPYKIAFTASTMWRAEIPNASTSSSGLPECGKPFTASSLNFAGAAPAAAKACNTASPNPPSGQ